MARILLIALALCSAVWIGATATFFLPKFLPDERERLGKEAVPFDCRKAKSADDCAEKLKSLGLNPFAAYGYADVLPLYGPIVRPPPPYIKIGIIALLPPLGVLIGGAGVLWLHGRLGRRKELGDEQGAH